MRLALIASSLIMLTGCLQSLPPGASQDTSGVVGSTPAEQSAEDDVDAETSPLDHDATGSDPGADVTPAQRTDSIGADAAEDVEGVQSGDAQDASASKDDTHAGATDALDGQAAEDGPDEGGALPSASLLSLTVPVDAPVGRPIPLLVSGPEDWSGSVTLTVAGQTREVMLHRGRGSLTLALTQEESVTISEVGGDAETISVIVTSRPERALTGTLGGDDLTWDAEADVHLDGVVTVSEGTQLSITPGARVFLEPNARLEIAGDLSATGPILFTRASQEAWGGLVVNPGGTATLHDAWFVSGGGDDTKTFGHSDSQPVVKASSGALTMTGGGILDSPGKALGGYKATLSLTDVLISRCDTGGEFVQSSLIASGLHVLEIPDADGVATDDDNDGLYFVGALMVDDEVVGSSLTDVVFSAGEDDAIDHNDAELVVTRAWITGFAHEGVAASGGRTLTVNDSVIQGCDQGIEAGYGAPQVVVRGGLITGNRVGLRFGDAYSWADDGTLDVSHTVSVQNTEANVLNLTDTGGPKPGAIQIACSMVDDIAFDDHDGNLPGVPDWQANGCVDAPLCEDTLIGPDLCE
jgi:hypothetical protein